MQDGAFTKNQHQRACFSMHAACRVADTHELFTQDTHWSELCADQTNKPCTRQRYGYLFPVMILDASSIRLNELPRPSVDASRCTQRRKQEAPRAVAVRRPLHQVQIRFESHSLLILCNISKTNHELRSGHSPGSKQRIRHDLS